MLFSLCSRLLSAQWLSFALKFWLNREGQSPFHNTNIFILINTICPLLYGPQSAVSSAASSPSVFLHLGLHRYPLQLQNNALLVFFHCAFSRSVPFVMTYLCITHLFLIISPLIFQFSLLCRPPSLHPFSSASLKAFHLSTISVPATPTHPHSTQFLSSPLYSFISSFPILLLYLSARLPPASSLSVPSVPSLSFLLPPAPTPLSHPPPAEIKPRWREPGPATSPTEAQPHGPKKQTLKNKIKYIKTGMGSLLRGQCIFLDTISHFYTLPALLHPVCLCSSPSVCFAPSLLPFLLRQTLSQS